jgi:hypothetical protein
LWQLAVVATTAREFRKRSCSAAGLCGFAELRSVRNIVPHKTPIRTPPNWVQELCAAELPQHNPGPTEICSARNFVPQIPPFRRIPLQRHTHGSFAAVGLRTTAFYAAAADFVRRHRMPLQRTS